MQLLFEFLSDPNLPQEKRELAMNALLKRESSALYAALHGEAGEEFALPDGIPPLLFFYIDDGKCTEEEREKLLSSLRETFPHTALAMGEEGIALCCHCPLEERSKRILAYEELLKHTACRGAVSQSVFNGTFSKHLKLTRCVYSVSQQVKSRETLARFESYASMVLFSILQEHMPLSLYHAEEALLVIEQDYENNTELSKSLYGYLACFLDLKQAALQTGIHRNTIAYHIRKIMGMIRADHMDGNLGFDILSTYRMLSMMEP